QLTTYGSCSLGFGSVIMRPDDANIVGNVHGGTILKMIEEAGCIIGTRHCNTQTGDRCVAALARVERTDFLHPMFIGEVAHVSAEITYTSKHSVEVQVNVLSENIVTGAKKLTNKAALWYVPFSLQNVAEIIEVPPIEFLIKEHEEYFFCGIRKLFIYVFIYCSDNKFCFLLLFADLYIKLYLYPYTVAFSQSSLIHLIGPSDCTLHGFVHGALNFVPAVHYVIKLCVSAGCVITISGRMTFTSNKSMEIEVFVDADPLVEAEKGKYRAVTAFFTYISLDKDNKPLPVPPLKLEGEEEQKRFEEGKVRYLQNKAKRLADKDRQQ
uniref:Acyl-CoA thioesterase 7 n=1 Tax=Sinocyclocheilus grahami TaxID=75366 RepID=A0A672L2U5_SINGR